MRISMALLSAIGLVIGCASNTTGTSENTNTSKIRNMQENQVTKQTGIVDFWESLGKYTISYSIENTIDSRNTCVVPEADMIPQQLRKAGTKVVFSGTLTKDLTLPPPRMGGEQVFLLAKLDDIQSFNNPQN